MAKAAGLLLVVDLSRDLWNGLQPVQPTRAGHDRPCNAGPNFRRPPSPVWVEWRWWTGSRRPVRGDRAPQCVTRLGLGANEVAILSPLALPDSEALLERAGLNVGMDHGPKVFGALAHLHLVDLMGVRLLYSVHRLPHPSFS